MATKVFLLDGFGFDGFLPLTQIVQSLGAPTDLVQITYNNDVGNNLPAITEAVEIVDTHISNAGYAGDDKIVVGISQGCQVAYKWLRDRGPTSTIPPSELRFVLLANPENRYTGAAVIAPQTYGGGYGGIGVPADTPYEVLNFTRQYDGVADYPNRVGANFNAVWNAMCGMLLIHNNYFSVLLDDPDNVSITPEISPGVPGNVTYMWSPTYPLPIFGSPGEIKITPPNLTVAPTITPAQRQLQRLMAAVVPPNQCCPKCATKTKTAVPAVAAKSRASKRVGSGIVAKLLGPWSTAGRDQATRPNIESAYDRPVVIPPPVYA